MRRERGFSTVELMVAAATLAVMSGVAISAMSEAVPRWRTKQAASDLAASIRTTRACAVRTRTPQAMAFDLNNGRFTRPDVDGDRVITVELPAGVSFSRPDRSTPPVDVRVPGDTYPKVEFNARGRLRSATLPGVIYLGDGKRGTYCRVVVEMTGAVRVERWEGSRWR